MTGPDANIHHFSHDPNKDDYYLDGEGDPMHGYYFEILGPDGQPLHALTGPYHSAEDAEEACHNAWKTKSYK